jgi:hypothetical protein
MSPRHLSALCALALAAPLITPVAFAQTAEDPNEGLKLTVDTAITNGYQVSWWGRSGRTYFLQRSEDLIGRWSYFPLIEIGKDAPLSYGFVNPSPLVFARVTYLDQILTDPYGTDSDSDGLSNQEEFWFKTELFSPDHDGDGVVDGLDAFPTDPERHLFEGTLSVTLTSPPDALALP